ncbi:hypothetical protein EDD18DRAFT_1442485 [Armillaria luteobubalina]|uniref:Uncharacterized protein n=1 Tax=Armillaria luteobubalina TaxID=153913 RepID=A0AA39QBJ0_9AGAR|nr:hypothetical protein EDD18DRAFT_1442485 [Armillaria luteobubalina]
MLPKYAFEEMLARHDWTLTFAHPPDVDSLFHTNNTVQIKTSLDSLEAVSGTQVLFTSRKRGRKREYDLRRKRSRTLYLHLLGRKKIQYESKQGGEGRSKLNVFLLQGGPWRLGQVCSSWRSAVETLCPELWSTLSIKIPFYPCLKNRYIEALRCVLKRGRYHPLHFTFDQSSINWDDTSLQVMEQCFNVMMAHSARLDLIRGKIGWFKMDLVCFDNSSFDSKSIHAFEIAPSLQVLHLRGMHPKANIPFPTVNLISFSDERPWFGDRMNPEYLGVVKSALKLRSSSYVDHGPARPISASQTVERAINLSIEKLSTCSQDFMCGVPPCVKGSHTDSPILDDKLPAILRLSPQLEEFSILLEVWMDEYDLVMRDLVTQMKETIMVEGSPQHCLILSLQQFNIRLLHVFYSTLSFLDLNFVEMIASRVHEPHVAPRLADLHIMVPGHRWTSCLDKDDVLALKDRGLDVVVILSGLDR